MSLHVKYFESLEHLEPKCPSCGQRLVYGETTDYDEEQQSHVCRCGAVV